MRKFGSQALSRMHSIMVSNGIEYYCDYGTLMGFVREGDFIKHDDDIDISIRPGSAKAVDVLKVFLDAGYGYIHAFEYNGELMEFTVADLTGIPIDVFFPKAVSAGKIHGYQSVWSPDFKYPDEVSNTLIEYDFVEAADVHPITVVGTEVLVPGNYDEVLTSEYGPWRVPNSKFDTVTDRVHRQMPGFSRTVQRHEALGEARA